MKYSQDTDLGKICIEEKDNCLVSLLLLTPDKLPDTTAMSGKSSPLLRESFKQLNAYLAGKLFAFSLPLKPEGTEFMQKVWAKLCEIPYGQTASYKQIAEAIGNNKAVRAVGLANNRNPLPIFIPCHRVIGSDGRLVGYGLGLDIKEKLLLLEKEALKNTGNQPS